MEYNEIVIHIKRYIQNELKVSPPPKPLLFQKCIEILKSDETHVQSSRWGFPLIKKFWLWRAEEATKRDNFNISKWKMDLVTHHWKNLFKKIIFLKQLCLAMVIKEVQDPPEIKPFHFYVGNMSEFWKTCDLSV